ncbi:MAG: hypothetical protein U9Q83_12170 [Bacteroidota bacterium]|nr:hypothetical protein [Bacteroidota bacterium]
MKTINKNIITVLIIIFAGIFITSCDSCMPEPKPYYVYLPDSLKFPFMTGDSVYYISTNNDTEKFIITLSDDIFYPDDTYNPKYYYQLEYLSLINEKFEITLEINKPSLILYYNLYYDSDICSCDDQGNSLDFGNLYIGDSLYENVKLLNKCSCINSAYGNIRNGLIRYITNGNDTFDLYKYIPINSVAK